MPDTDTILDEPEVDQEQDQPQPDQQPAPAPQQPQGPGPQQPSLKDEDKQKLVKIITNMQKAGESDDNIKAVVKRYQELNTPKQTTTPVDQGIRATDKSLNQPIQFNGTFKPDLEGEKKGLYTNDPDYQKQKNDFVQRIATDANGKLLYPEQDQTSGQWFNYYTKQPIPNFDPRSMRGAILQVPHEYLPATGGEKFITAKYDSENGSYSFPSVQTPDVPTVQNLPQATVYGKKGAADQTQYSGAAGLMVNESDKQGGELRNVLKAHPELSGQIDETLAKYGPEYSASLATGHDAMSNVLQKTVEDHYDLNKPLPANVDASVLDGHLNVLNNFEKNRQSFELNQRELQRQADLLTDRAKRTGEPVSREDAEKLAQKASQNIQQWDEYSKSVNFSQNYVNQPEVKNYLDEFKKRQQGIQLIDELRQRAFPDEVNASMKQDAYDRKAIEGNLNAWDYTKTALGKAGSALANIGETALKEQSGGNPLMNTAIEGLNNSAQDFLKSNLNAISPEAVDQMNKLGIGHLVNDLSSTVGGIAPYVIPGAAGEGLGAKAATFATALAEGLPDARKEAEKQGLTGAAYNTYVAAKPLVSAAFMTMLPNVKFAKGFENDVAKAVVDGEFNNPKRALLNLASKVVTVHPGDVAHLQAMLSGTALGEALVNKVANGLQATENLHRGISQTQDLPTELSNVFNPRQTAVMALTGKLLEAVPTLKNSIGELSKGKDIQSTYDHIQNNLVELAGHNLEGVSKQVNALVQKDPGNIYAQHLKTTLEDFAHSEARMPEGLAPEQKAALFDVQKQILQKQRQMAYADPVYQPHLQKNIDELDKQIPDILKDPKKANDYLASGHKDFAREILNTDADEKLLKGNKEKDLADLKDRESALDPKSATYAVKKEALEKERAETEDYYDSRLKNISSPKTENNGKDKNAPTEAEGQQGQISEKPTEGAEPNNLLMDRTAPSIQPESWARTLDYGNNKGKEETKEAQDKIKDEILNDKPIGENGEKFSQLLGRVIPGVQKVMKEDPHNTAIVTHSSVIKALDVWEEMGRPDVSELKGDKLKEFAQKYIDLKPEAEGKVHTFKGEDGKEIKVIRHGETEDNVASEFREDNTKLTDKGEAQAARAGDNLIKETGGNIPKIISSNLPRTMHTSDIINSKLQEHAVQIGRPTQVLQREQGENGGAGGERGRMESSEQGNEPAGESAGSAEEKGKDSGKEAPEIKGEPETISTKRSVNDVVRQRMNLPEVPIPKLGTDSEEMTKAKERVDSGKSSPLDIVDKIISTPDIKDIGLSTNDRYDMQYHMLQLKQKSLELNKAMSETTDKLAEDPENKKAQEDFISLTQQRAQHMDDYIRATEANRIGSAVWGQSGNAMQVEMDEHGQLLARVQRIKDWYGGNVPEDVQKKLDDIQKQLDESNVKLQKLQEDYNKKVVEIEALKAAKSAATKTRKTSEQFKTERKNIVSDLKEALRKTRGDLSATIAPGVKELAAIAPHLLKLFKSYAAEGFQKVDEVLDKMLKDVEPAVPGITKNDIHDVLAGKYKETKKPIEKNQEYTKEQQKKANAMMMLRKIEQQAMDSKKNWYMKSLDFATQWERRAIFAFNNAVFLKLSSAALLGSTVHKPLEFAVGKGAAKLFPKLADKAIIEGNENLASLAKFYSEEFNPKKFAQQTWQIYKRGESGLTQELSQKGHVGYTYDKWYDYAKPVLDAYTNTHQVIKDPIKRAVMESSMLNILQWYRGQGMDPTHPLILEDARQYAYKRAEYEIFQNKQGISSKINSLIGELEKSGIIQASQPGLHNKVAGNLKYTASTLYHMLVPIATVPINITARASVGALLPYNIIKAYHLENNIKDLPPEQADIVMRQLKKGAIGAAYWTLGVFLVGNAGGLWNRYDPDKKKSGQRDIDLKTGRPHSDVLKLGDLDIPKGVQHTPQLQSLQYGATFANVHNHYVQDLKAPEYQAWGAGIMATLGAMVENVPPAEETKKLIEGIEDPNQLQKVGQDLKRGFGYTKLQDAGILPPDAPKPPAGHRRSHR